MLPRVSSRASTTIRVPPSHDWRTTDEDEINKRRLRGQTESFAISNLDSRHTVFSNFRVQSRSGMTYSTEIRDLRQKQFACECVDFRTNGLGTCKHVEAVLVHLRTKQSRAFQQATAEGSTRIDVVPDVVSDRLRIERGAEQLPRRWQPSFTNVSIHGDSPERIVSALRGADVAGLRISQEVSEWLESRRRTEEGKLLRREYEAKVHAGEWPVQETLVPLYPYQREGMLHLAFTEKALLADEMGLGKTIQAIAACALLHRLGKVQRVLVVTPASLKTEWEEQIQRFTPLPYRIVFGNRTERLKAYEAPPFFTIVNYEQVMRDAPDVNERLKPDLVILDEAQRIKNWNTQTAHAVKRLRSRYAFVLTGTPIENRIDELYSLMDFLEPAILGPLFRFNREFYQLDDHGKPVGYRNLDKLHARIKPFLLRRRKADVETELPDRTDRTFFVPLSNIQAERYADHEAQVARLSNVAQRRPLTQQEQEKLLRELAMMRMICDTNYILDETEKTCPKLAELEKILDECRENSEVKVIIFSEWERMLELVRELCQRLKLGFAWHTGSVPQRRRRDEINRFKTDADCRVFLSTDSGSTGLNLQAASVVINCDLPWNPAKLEQRIARAWRKHQTRAVTVIHLVTENTIEHRMLGTLAHKQALADGVLDLRGDLKEIKLTSGRQSFLEKIRGLVSASATPSEPPPAKPKFPTADRARAFSESASARLGGALLRCEERYPAEGVHPVLLVVVERDAMQCEQRLRPMFHELLGTSPADAGASTRLEVIDRATDEALKRLIDAGVLTRTTRAVRSLHPVEDDPTRKKSTLTDAERQMIQSLCTQAARKLKVARVLGEAQLAEEARAAVQEAATWIGRALAVQYHFPEPMNLNAALTPPLSLAWAESLARMRSFVADATGAVLPLIESLEELLTTFD
ncbi:MAG: DEAD/DEAH box helicase [Verrucomicrobiae bacterium]|nr:DEAD/DEAH box helicase [Verrucomicrobiae bacterium]